MRMVGVGATQGYSRDSQTLDQLRAWNSQRVSGTLISQARDVTETLTTAQLPFILTAYKIKLLAQRLEIL